MVELSHMAHKSHHADTPHACYRASVNHPSQIPRCRKREVRLVQSTPGHASLFQPGQFSATMPGIHSDTPVAASPPLPGNVVFETGMGKITIEL